MRVLTKRSIPWLLVTLACFGIALALSFTNKLQGDDKTESVSTSQSVEVDDFALTLLDQHFSGQWGPLYDKLHPLQQAMFTREEYINCAQEKAQNAIITDSAPEVSVVTTYEEDVVIPGTVLQVNATAVTIQYEQGIRNGRQTLHFIPTGNDWSWMLLNPEECEG